MSNTETGGITVAQSPRQISKNLIIRPEIPWTNTQDGLLRPHPYCILPDSQSAQVIRFHALQFRIFGLEQRNKRNEQGEIKHDQAPRVDYCHHYQGQESFKPPAIFQRENN